MNGFLASPLFGITITAAVFQAATLLYRRTRLIIFTPAAASIFFIILLLTALGIPYGDYQKGGQMIQFLLGPSVVALAVPLYELRKEVLKRKYPILLGVLVGALTSIVSSGGIAWLFGATTDVVISTLPKSATTPIALGISEKTGGIAPLTAAMVVFTGCLGAVCGPEFCRLVGVRAKAAMGLAMGTACHGLGTARMIEIDRFGAAIAGLAIGLNGLATAIMVPAVTWLMGNAMR